MLADDRHRLVLQPIVDLARGMVVGHEALSRFPDHPPNVWFNVANGEGVSDVLDARILDKALRLRSTLPPDTFVTINIEPANLLSAPVTDALDQSERLDRVILELTEHSPLNDTADMQARMQVLRQRGALFALDDVGAGYAGLQAMLQWRPDVVKVDRSLVDHNAAAAQLDDIVAGLVERVPQVRGKDPIDPEMTVIVVDEYSHPAALWVDGILESRPLRVKPSEGVATVAARMADRSGPGRLLPAVVTMHRELPSAYCEPTDYCAIWPPKRCETDGCRRRHGRFSTAGQYRQGSDGAVGQNLLGLVSNVGFGRGRIRRPRVF
ncbi:hypothetical protein BH24ACT15_BH24ACT15_27150 [soil metagenome]